MTFPSIPTEGPKNTENWEALSSLLTSGKGDPAGKVRARVGALYLRQDGKAGATLYVKESGEGTSEGWVSK